MDIQKLLKEVTPQLQKLAYQCISADEIDKLAERSGISLSKAESERLFSCLHPAVGELNDDELALIAGGKGDSCKCNKKILRSIRIDDNGKTIMTFRCLDCKAISEKVYE